MADDHALVAGGGRLLAAPLGRAIAVPALVKFPGGLLTRQGRDRDESRAT